MRSKLHLQDLTILFVCPSQRWGTIERRCIQDMLFFRDLGGRAILACPSDSHLFQSAREQDIEVVPFEKADLFGFFRRIRSVMRVSHWLNIFQVNLVHLYNVDAVPVFSMSMQRKREIPFILTYGHPPKRKFTQAFNRWALKRVDSILTFSPIIEEAAKMNLPTNPRKFRSIGMGVTEVGLLKCPRGSEHFNLLAYAPKYWVTEKSILVLLRSLVGLKDEGNAFKCSLYLYTDGKWESLPFYQTLLSQIADNGLEEMVFFEEGEMFSGERTWHLFVGLETGEAISDREIISLIKGVPVLFPRTPTRQDLLSSYPYFGESYKKGDSRELKVKCLKLLSQHANYIDQLELKREFLLERHGAEGYHQELYELYSRLYDQRKRLARHVTHANS